MDGVFYEKNDLFLSYIYLICWPFLRTFLLSGQDAASK